MATVLPDMGLNQFQYFIKEVYEVPNNRNFELGEMLNNVQRFCMRGLKGIRKNNLEQTKKNLIISFSFFMSILNRIEVSVEEETWKRFPNVCSYCNSLPCACKEKHTEFRQEVSILDSNKPLTLKDFQDMFERIYPSATRTLEHAGVHLAEEMGEFSEAIWAYRSERTEKDFDKIKLEVADYMSCIMGVFNSLNLDLAVEISKMYKKNCHECNTSPCSCSHEKIKKYRVV